MPDTDPPGSQFGDKAADVQRKHAINRVSTDIYQTQQEPASGSQHIQTNQEVQLRERVNDNSINCGPTGTNRTQQEVTNLGWNIGTEMMGREVPNNTMQHEVKQNNYWQNDQTVSVREEVINTNN